jgi:cytoskeletal protein CcmA (bactofilin family)
MRKPITEDRYTQGPQGTFIGQGIKIEAVKITGSEPMTINGAILGDIELDSTLTIGGTGAIIGNIRARQLVVDGRIKGTINCDTTIHLTSNAYVLGSITTHALKTEEGARINGQCRMDEGGAESSEVEIFELEGRPPYDFGRLGEPEIPESAALVSDNA